MSEELVEIKRESAMQVFTEPAGVDPYLAKIRAEIVAFVPGDVAVKKEREKIASMAFKIAKTKSYLEGVGKDLADEAKLIPKKIDAARKKIKDTLDQWKDEVRAPLTAWEQAEEARVARITEIVEGWKAIAEDHGMHPAYVLTAKLDEVKGVPITEEAFQEFTAAAGQAKDNAVRVLESHLAAAIKREAEAVELEKLRKESAERAAKEREEQIARDAAANAVASQERAAKAAEAAAIKREADLKAQAEHAANKQREAEERAVKAEHEAKERATKAAADAKVQAEREQAAKVQAEADATAKREANKKHAAKINSSALVAFVKGGLTEDQAKLAVTLIASRQIPAVSITY